MRSVSKLHYPLTQWLTRRLFGESVLLARAGLPGMPRPWKPWYLVSGGVVRLFFEIFARWERVGMENIRRRAASSSPRTMLRRRIQPCWLRGCIPRWPKFMAKLELFQKRPLVGILFAWAGAFPVRRFDADLAALREAERQLAAGEILGMFPEGHRSEDASLLEAHHGTALIALRSDAPIVPIGITGSEQFRQGWRVFFRRPCVRVVYGTPFVLKAETVRRADVEAGTERIMREIAALIPAEYRGVYRDRFSDLPAEASVEADKSSATRARPPTRRDRAWKSASHATWASALGYAGRWR